ncbi:MAG: hypothetical protein FWD48_09695 [Oscillospiraceae bacterium]|nr:hypothetical protein [Oscillospiraceae bacterium]
MKKLSAFLLTAIILIGLTACGGEIEIAEALTTPPPVGDTPPQEGNELDVEDNEFPSEEGWTAQPDGVVDDHEPEITSRERLPHHYDVNTTEDRGEALLEIYAFLDGAWRSTVINSYAFWLTLNVTDEFIELVDENEYENWQNKYLSKDFFENWHGIHAVREIRALYTDFNEFINLVSFISDFDLSEQQVREALLKWNEFGDGGVMYTKHIYSEEEITALATRNKEDIVALFRMGESWPPLPLIKHDKLYAIGWFFYASPEDYKAHDITKDDMTFVIKELNGFIAFEDGLNYGFAFPHFKDVIQQKFYDYFNGDICVMELCGYERDFDMPLAFENYWTNRVGSYWHFFDSRTDYGLFKNNFNYTPHWIYYNNHEAYSEADITPEELTNMIPKFKALDILSIEAIAALENKIMLYEDYYNLLQD